MNDYRLSSLIDEFLDEEEEEDSAYGNARNFEKVVCAMAKNREMDLKKFVSSEGIVEYEELLEDVEKRVVYYEK